MNMIYISADQLWRILKSNQLWSLHDSSPQSAPFLHFSRCYHLSLSCWDLYANLWFFFFLLCLYAPCNVSWFWTWVSRLKFETFQIYRIFWIVTVPKDLGDFHFWSGFMKWNQSSSYGENLEGGFSSPVQQRSDLIILCRVVHKIHMYGNTASFTLQLVECTIRS